MQAAAQQLADSIVSATAVTHNPASSQQSRAEAVAFFEQLKHGEIHSTVFAAAVLTGTQYALEVQVSAYSLLQYLVRHRWGELSAQEQLQVTQLAYQHMLDVGHLGSSAAWALKSKSAMLLAAVVRQQGPDSFAQLLPQLLNAAAEGPMQAEISCMVLQFVAEDITQFEERTGDWRRSFLAALLASVDTVFPALVKLLQDHFSAGMTASQQGPPDAARAHAAVVNAALGALSSYVEWAPLAKVGGGSVVEACAFFLGAPDFRDAALGVLKQICCRRSMREGAEAEAYAALIDKVADALIGACAAVLTPEAAPQLDYEGALEDYGRRLAGCVAAFCDFHYSALPNVQKRYALLEKMLAFTRNPYLQLSAATLPFWVDALREAGIMPGGLTRPVATGIVYPPGSAAAAAAGGAAGGEQAAEAILPTECCQLLVEALAEQMTRVVSRAEEGEGGEPPMWADSAADYKDFCCNYRSQAKVVIRGVARLAPQQALASAAAFLGQALAACASDAAATPAKQVALEAAVQVLEAVIPALVGGEGASGAGPAPPAAGAASAAGAGGAAPPPAVAVPAVAEALKAMLQQLLTLRLRDPILVMLHARSLEAFSRFVALHGDLLVPLVQASFECLQVIPIEQNGQLPPPAKVSQQWKEEAVARTAMAKVLLNCAKEAPAAFLPHLEPLVARVQQLWDQGLLRQGEKVSLYEGLMAAATSGGPELQGQLLEWLLRPVAAKWSQPAWQATVEAPEAFAREYMSFEVQPGGAVVIESRPQRWALHYELQLFERALRHTQATAQQQQQQQQLGAGAPQHPFAPHLEWSMLAIGRIMRCLHGLQAPEMIRGPIAPLAPSFDMDAVERALRSGGEREAAKKSEEDAGTIAGTNHAALRYWMRSIREGAYMVLSYAAQGVGAPLWLNQRLAAALPQDLAAYTDSMDDRHVRILLRHAVTPLVAHCPVAVRPPWLLPVFSVLLPNMHARLTEGWKRVAATGGSGADGAVQQQQQQQQQQQPQQQPAPGGEAQVQQRLSDEVVAESVLRDVSREYMALLAKVAERGGGSTPAAGRPASGSAGGGRAASPALGAPPGGAGAGGGGGGGSGSGGGARKAEEESVLESLWRYDVKCVCALVATAIAALCWPDAAAAGRACAVCRAVASLAESSHPELEGLVLSDMLRSAILSTVQVSHITIQAEVLGVIRQLLVAWLPRSAVIRDILLSLPHVTPQVLASFQDQLLSIGSEKEQRNLIKRLLAEAGGEQARAVLSAVSKVPVTNLPDPAAAGGRAARAAGARGEDEIRWDWSSAGVAI